MGHWACARKDRAISRKESEWSETTSLTRRKYEVGGQDRSCMDQAERKRSRIKAVPYYLNGKKLSWDELREDMKL